MPDKSTRHSERAAFFSWIRLIRTEDVMKISPQQIDALGGYMAERFKRDLLTHAQAYFPTVAAVVGESGLSAFLDAAIARAKARGFTGRAEIRAYADAMALLGAEFEADPILIDIAQELDADRARAMLREQDGLDDRDANPNAADAADDADDADDADQDGGPDGIPVDPAESDPYAPDPLDMLDDMHATAWVWLDRVAQDDYAAVYKAVARLAHLLERAEGVDARTVTELCERIYPEKFAATPEDRLKAFLNAAAGRAQQDGITDLPGMIAYALIGFVGGLGAPRDPLVAVDGVQILRAIDGETGSARGVALGRAFCVYAARLLHAARAQASLDAPQKEASDG
jgi:hypothetical protein